MHVSDSSANIPKHLPPIAGGNAPVAAGHFAADAADTSQPQESTEVEELPSYEWLLASVAIFAMEMILKASVGGGFSGTALAAIALFSCAVGMLLNFLVALLPGKADTKRIVKSLLLALCAVVFGIQHFIFREFKLFYDLRTILAGTGHAVGQFAGEIQRMVFSPSGIGLILALFAPVLLYFLLARPRTQSSSPSFVARHPKLLPFVASLASGIAALALVANSGPFGRSFTDRYNFQTAVDNCGLLAGIARDGVELAFPTQGGFESQADLNKAVIRRQPEVDHTPVVMDIDFEALAQSAPDSRLADLDRYVASVEPSHTNAMTGRFKGYNLIFISAEAFSAEAIREDTTPTLYRMANRGIQFTDYYQFDTAGTTGGECGNIFGVLPTRGGSSVKGKANHNNYMTIGSQLDRMGYKGWVFHNNSYTYYDRHLTHTNLGYSEGYMGYGNGMEEWVEWQWPQSDLEMVQGTFQNLYGSHDMEPFNVYYMSVSGHSDYSRDGNAMSKKNWEVVQDLPYSEPVKAYLAANVELDRAMEWLIGALEENDMLSHTLIVIGADHFPYGLDNDGALGSLPLTSELYGYDVTDIFQRDHNRLIMWSASLERERPIVVDSPTFACDILPTLSNLMGCEWDSRLLPGRDVFSEAEPLVFNLNYDWKTDLGTYYAGSATFVPVSDDVQLPEGYIEAHNAIVANKINFCRGLLETDYYGHVFGQEE